MIAVLLAGVCALAGCAGGGAAPAPTHAAGPDTCAPLAVPVATGGTSDVSRAALPDVALPCFTGDRIVQVGQLRGPAVINLWASWCGPCRTELPAFERYARRANGLVTVVGVNTEDTRTGGTSIVEDLHLTFPNLLDERGKLRTTLGRTALPVTVFVDRDGRIAYVYNAEALDEDNLELRVEQYLGVVVPKR
jgi:thiol-disulfide isomerase/thioredoxin